MNKSKTSLEKRLALITPATISDAKEALSAFLSYIPRSGLELARLIGAELDEGVIVSLLPEEMGKCWYYETSWRWDPGHMATAVMADCGPLGDRLIDVMLDPPDEDIRWWRVRDSVPHGLNLLPERWHGPLGEIPETYFNIPEPTVVAMRLYAAGPWFFPFQRAEATHEIEPFTPVANSVRGDGEQDGE